MNKYLDEWKEELKKTLILEDVEVTINILLVPEHYSNSAFVEWILSEVFNRAGIVIREDFNKEFYSNFKEKYQYIRNSNVKKRFFFIDDILTSGRTFLRCRALAEELSGDQSLSIPVKDLISTITLMIRLDHQNYTLVNGSLVGECYSFLEIYIPVIKEQTDTCWLCEEEHNLLKMAQDTIDYEFKEFLTICREDCLVRVDVTNGYSENFQKYIDRAQNNQYIQERFLLANRIYFKLVEINKQSQIDQDYDEEKLKEQLYPLFGLDSNGSHINENIVVPGTKIDTSYKMNLIRVIGMPFLNYFKVIRKIAHKLCLSELNEILKQIPKPSENDFEVSQKYLLLLVTQLSMLNSSFIISKENLRNIFNYLYTIKEGIKNNPFLRYRYAIKRLCINDQTMELILIKNAISLLRELGDDDNLEFREYLEWLILDNNTIITNAIEYMRRDETILTTIVDNRHKILENYYYEHYCELWSLFCMEEIDLENKYSLLSIVSSNDNFKNKANSMLGGNVCYYFSYNKDNEEYTPTPPKASSKYKPPDGEYRPIFKEEKKYCYWTIYGKYNRVIVLDEDKSMSMLYLKFLLSTNDDIVNEIDEIKSTFTIDDPNTAIKAFK